MYGGRALHPLSVSENQLMESKVDVGWILAPTEYVQNSLLGKAWIEDTSTEYTVHQTNSMYVVAPLVGT